MTRSQRARKPGNKCCLGIPGSKLEKLNSIIKVKGLAWPKYKTKTRRSGRHRDQVRSLEQGLQRKKTVQNNCCVDRAEEPRIRMALMGPLGLKDRMGGIRHHGPAPTSDPEDTSQEKTQEPLVVKNLTSFKVTAAAFRHFRCFSPPRLETHGKRWFHKVRSDLPDLVLDGFLYYPFIPTTPSSRHCPHPHFTGESAEA